MTCRGAWAILLLGLSLPHLAACTEPPRARSQQSFDEIARRVADLPADEIGRLLGDPDSRQPVYVRDERWIWWNYTYLDGEDYPPEIRGQIVHLEITFRKPQASPGRTAPMSEWWVARPYGVAFRRPGDGARSTGPPSQMTPPAAGPR